MKKIIDFCLGNNILVFDGRADDYDSLTKRLLYLTKQEYNKWFDEEPTFYFESGVSKKRLGDLGLKNHKILDEELVYYFFDNDEFCQKRDEHVFVLADSNGNGIVGCYT